MIRKSFSSPSYRYGFNGKEKDDEISGNGNSYDYGFRIYNPRLGKFLSVDPLVRSYPWYSPYMYAGNKPIWAIDLDGLEDVLIGTYSVNNIPFLTITSFVQTQNRATGKSVGFVTLNKNNANPTRADLNRKASFGSNDWLPEDVKSISEIGDANTKSNAETVSQGRGRYTIVNANIPEQVSAQFTVNVDDKEELYRSLSIEDKSNVEIIAVSLLKFDGLKANIEGSASSGGNAKANATLAQNRADAIKQAIIEIATNSGATEAQVVSINKRLTTSSVVATGEVKVEDQKATITIIGGNDAVQSEAGKFATDNGI